MTIYLSGITPSGLPHLGNYFGAIEQHIRLQEQGGEHYYFIADYHALTTNPKAQDLRQRVREIAATYLGLGLDPERAVLFRQSDVPEVCEIAWMLASVTGMGLLERAVSYKDKVAKGLKPLVGLFTYPVLMAADILAYDADIVPVGQDQMQHIEMAQDMAGHFNTLYGPVFHRPEALVSKSLRVAKVPGLDGEKMSKSYQNDIWIFESGNRLKKRVARVLTDSRPPEEPKDPDELVLVQMLELFLEPEELADWKDRLRRGGAGAPGYGHLKERLEAAIETRFGAARTRREELLADPGELEGILRRGAERAREHAVRTCERARAACGLR